MASEKQLSLIVGVAGAGKTTIMEGAMQALQQQGYRVRGAAPSGIAASGLKDIGMQASTLHSLEAQIAMAQAMLDENTGKPLSVKQRYYLQRTMLSSRDVLIVDEAGMVSAKQLFNIMQLCQQSGAKLVLVGDPQQLQSIEAGKAFQALLDRHDSISLTEVRRQQPAWQREATVRCASKDIASALQAYTKHGCIHTGYDNRDDAKLALVADLMQSSEKNPDRQRLVLAYTRKDVADLNKLIKAEMIKRGRVSATDTDITITQREEEQDIEVKQGFATGDRILFRENNKELGVMNGTFGTLQAIEGGLLHVQLDNGQHITFSPLDYNRFQLGYAATVHKSQGVTVDETYVLATPHFDQHTSYVAMSRHKHQLQLYASKEDFKNERHLLRMLGREGEKLSTLDFIAAPVKHMTQKSRETSLFLTQPLRQFWQKLRGKQKAPQPVQTQSAPAKPEHWIVPMQPTKPASQPQREKTPQPSLSHTDLARLRDTFVKQAAPHRASEQTRQKQNHQHNHTPTRHGPDLER